MTFRGRELYNSKYKCWFVLRRRRLPWLHGKRSFAEDVGRQLLDLCRLAKGGNRMSEIRVKDNESLDNALKRFKRSCAKSGVLAEVRKREHYEKPSVRRKKKSEAARKRKFK